VKTATTSTSGFSPSIMAKRDAQISSKVGAAQSVCGSLHDANLFSAAA